MLDTSVFQGQMHQSGRTSVLQRVLSNQFLRQGDCLVINDTKVIPARLYGHKEETGALIEILLLKRRENDIWECLVKPGKKKKKNRISLNRRLSLKRKKQAND